jgi:hypothetical protein
VTIARLAGEITAPPRPCSTPAPTSIDEESASAQASDAARWGFVARARATGRARSSRARLEDVRSLYDRRDARLPDLL